MDILQSNNILTPDAQHFIKQDAVAIFNNTPGWTETIAKTITDLGARANRFINGEGLKQYISHQKKLVKQLKMNWVKDIVISPLKTKKYRVIFKDGSHLDYGAAGMSDYLIHQDEKEESDFIIVSRIIKAITINDLVCIIQDFCCGDLQYFLNYSINC